MAWAASDREEALRLLATTGVDALLTDINIRGRPEGLDLIATVKQQWPNVSAVALSAAADEEAIAAAIAAGAVTFIPKDLPADEMVRILLSLKPRNGSHGARDGGALRGLSRRELEVLAEMRVGSTNREIARRLGISTTTVNKHVHKILAKMGARNRAQAIGLSPRG